LIVALLVKINLGSPIIYKQKRPGLNEKIFNLYKFRSMSNKKDIFGNLLPNYLRINKFGKFLRSTSLDELPSLINIVKGDLSIVGPRPLLVEYLSLYTEQQRLRHLVRPGLTGLAQVNGRNQISWKEKFRYDNLYIKNITFLGDLRIIFSTIRKVIKKEGINQSDTTSMEKFNGDN
jgi:lipopolysaccharide/colanic/teichoic acid biosynthesis glycosyltransferase